MYTGTGLKNINIQPDYAMDSQVDFKEVVVIDNGSDLLKIGFSGDDWPQVKFYSGFFFLTCFFRSLCLLSWESREQK
jgi:hypothetical protein